MIAATDLRETVQQNIRLGRRLAGLTQDELADRIGARDHNEISRYEHGRRSPKPDRLLKIADALGQPYAWFFEPHEATK